MPVPSFVPLSKMKNTLFILFIGLLCFQACKDPEEILTQGFDLSFSTDTVMFDTVFTTIGSSTRQLRVINPTNETIEIGRIELAKGNQSFFRLNIDGVPTNATNNYTLEANDSLYIFIDVNVDPTNVNSPLIITDSIRFILDDRQQDVDLVAWGQDAYFYGPTNNGSIFYALPCNATLLADKPHVFYGYAVVDSACQLDVNPDVRMHFHANSGLIVNNAGTLKINGQKDQEVIIEGDRLEPFYENVPGQWGNYSFGGIWCSPGSIDNEINYAIIRNGLIGVHADTVGNSTNPTLKISNTIIENMGVAGLLGQGTRMEGDNLLIRNCGQFSLICNIGGDYRFRHCTFANYYNQGVRNRPTVLLNNYYESASGSIIARDLLQAYFSNCIVYGNIDGELAFDENTDGDFSPIFEDCIVKVDDDFDKNQPLRFQNTRFNINPKFKDPFAGNFELDTLSNAKDRANSIWISDPEMALDLNGDFRYSDASPDIGCYERQE